VRVCFASSFLHDILTRRVYPDTRVHAQLRHLAGLCSSKYWSLYRSSAQQSAASSQREAFRCLRGGRSTQQRIKRVKAAVAVAYRAKR
jgi:hypothetical protein